MPIAVAAQESRSWHQHCRAESYGRHARRRGRSGDERQCDDDVRLIGDATWLYGSIRRSP